MVNFLKLVLRVLETVLRNQKKSICKNPLTHLKRKCFSVFRQKQSCLHRVKNGSKNSQRFTFKPIKPFCLSSEQGFSVQTLFFKNLHHLNIKCKENVLSNVIYGVFY